MCVCVCVCVCVRERERETTRSFNTMVFIITCVLKYLQVSYWGDFDSLHAFGKPNVSLCVCCHTFCGPWENIHSRENLEVYFSFHCVWFCVVLDLLLIVYVHRYLCTYHVVDFLFLPIPALFSPSEYLCYEMKIKLWMSFKWHTLSCVYTVVIKAWLIRLNPAVVPLSKGHDEINIVILTVRVPAV